MGKNYKLCILLIFAAILSVFVPFDRKDAYADKPEGNVNLFTVDSYFIKGQRMGTSLKYENGIASYISDQQDIYPVYDSLIYNSKFYSAGEEKKFSELPVYFKATIKVSQMGNSEWNGIGLLLGNSGACYYYARLQQDGGFHILIYNSESGSESIYRTMYNTQFEVENNTEFVFEMERAPGSLTLKINGVVMYDNIPLPQLGSKIGLCFVQVKEASASGFEMYFTTPVTVEKIIEPEYSEEIVNYVYNTETIITHTIKTRNYMMIITGCFIILLSVVLAILGVVYKRRFFR
jgi:hypothetical protein